MSENSIPSGQQRVGTSADEFNRMSFLVTQALARLQTATIVKIAACTNDGGLTPVGFVDVIPMVNQLDGQGNPTEHATIFNVPYMRVQGGTNGIIIDPQVGDLGICLFASRDISKVKNTKDRANPGSFRTYSFADGMYIGGLLNGTPEQYVQFNTAGIEIHSPTLIKLTAPDIQLISETLEITASESITMATATLALNATTSTTFTTPTFTLNGNMLINGATTLAGSLAQTGGSSGNNAMLAGNLSVTGNVTTTSGDVAAGTISLKSHKHGGVQPGGGQTGGPV